jgi:hypothetical protein
MRLSFLIFVCNWSHFLFNRGIQTEILAPLKTMNIYVCRFLFVPNYVLYANFIPNLVFQVIRAESEPWFDDENKHSHAFFLFAD